MLRLFKNFFKYVTSILLARAYKRVAEDQRISVKTLQNVLTNFHNVPTLSNSLLVAALERVEKTPYSEDCVAILHKLSLQQLDIERVLNATDYFMDLEHVTVKHLVAYNDHKESVVQVIDAVLKHLEEGKQIDTAWVKSTIVNASPADYAMLSALAWHVAKMHPNYKKQDQGRGRRMSSQNKKQITQQLKEGVKSVTEIAKEFGFTVSAISQMKKRLKKAETPKQPEPKAAPVADPVAEKKDIVAQPLAEEVAKEVTEKLPKTPRSKRFKTGKFKK